ncbi:citrate/2-methylcitrate synthase [Parahaliea aestuarii]|uniref:Citrate synthase n=1 Tax=Parahaliea aestuarii TaxID=1852021 RepID=A0A5C9A2W7_9GAMM|nr:citrate/2-methylcitrate synthase [Parahaliea aestuarii]TXS94419.1 citrate/2-methylcitrate synthase [Parahaliea aestuarii]
MTASKPLESFDLAGVVVGETAISNVEGDLGRLSYRGVDINELVQRPFANVAWLVLFGSDADAARQLQLNRFLCAHAALTQEERGILKRLPRHLHPMLVLQGMVPLIELPTEETLGLGLEAEQGLVLAAKLSGLIAAWYRAEQGLAPLGGGPDDNFHANFLTRLHGQVPDGDAVKILDATQILQMEHSFNAGTFAGRVCASTLAPIQSVISASIGTLYGRLHGGADQAALEMAQAIGAPEKAAAYVARCLAEKTKIMGMGHREYRTVDPRAKLLKPMAMALCHDPDSRRLLDTLIAVEQACQTEFAKRDKEIWANVEFYKGAVFHSLGIPSHFFTAMFAMARVYGYIAHFLEFRRDSRLIRPRARYVAAGSHAGE